MNEFIYNNKICFLEQKESTSSYLFWVLIFLFLVIFLSCIFKVSFITPINAIYNYDTNELEFYWPYDKYEKITTIKQIRINDSKWNFQISNISEIKVDEINHINYQIISISSPKKFVKNQIIKIYLLDEKEILIKKILQIILGGR